MITANADFPYRLATVDLDDTLLGPDKRISAPNRAAIDGLRARGVEVVLASGRAMASMVGHHQELGLNGLMISLNGAVVSRPSTGELLRVHPLPAQTGSELAAAGIAQGFTVVACCTHRTFASGRTSMLDRYQSRGGEREAIVGFPEDFTREGLLKLIWIAPPAELDRLREDVSKLDPAILNVIRTESHHLEFMAAEADKASGLQVVAESLGLRREQTIAVGDGPNDVGMLTWAGMGIAVSHAAESARAAANFTGPATTNPAVAFAAAVSRVLSLPSDTSKWDSSEEEAH